MLHLTRAPATSCTAATLYMLQMVSRLTCQLPVMPLLASTHAVNLGVKHVPRPFMSYLPPYVETLSKTGEFSIAGEPWSSARAQSLDAASARTH